MNQEEANQKILELMNKEDVLYQEEIQLFKEIMFKCDLKIQGTYGFTPLMYALFFNQSQNLNLSEEQFNYLIQNSDLKQQNNIGYTPLMYALKYNQSQNLQLSIKQFKSMYDALNRKQKQNAFQKLIQEYVNNNKYQEEINLFLYDLQFQPDAKNLNFLQKNKYKNILEIIEKRDLFFQLKQDFKEIDKKEKIATIKL